MESFLEQNEYKYLIGDADTYGNTCLHYAATKKNKNFAQVLINNYEGKIKKIINKKNKFGDTPLDVAYSKKSSKVVTLLRQNGGKANRYDTNGKDVGKGKGDLNDFYDIAYKNVTLINNKYRKAFPKGTPLVCACEKGHFLSVRVLIEAHDVRAGISPDKMVMTQGTSSDGYSFIPLQAAAKYEHLNIVQYLVKRFPAKDLIGQTDSIGQNSLHYAAMYSKKNVDLLQFLIDNYIGDIQDIINQKNYYNSTPLDCAYKHNKSPIKKDIVALLRQFGGKANKYDTNGQFVGKNKGDLNDLYDNITIKF